MSALGPALAYLVNLHMLYGTTLSNVSLSPFCVDARAIALIALSGVCTLGSSANDNAPAGSAEERTEAGSTPVTRVAARCALAASAFAGA